MSSKNKLIENASKAKAGEGIWKKALVAKSDWPDKDEFLDVVYWIRQVLGIILGLGWGILPFRGFFGVLLFVLVNAAVLYIYVMNFQSIDEEEYGGIWEITKEGFMTSFAGFLVRNFENSGIWEITKEGFMTSFAGFLVTWIIVYTGLHGSDL